MSVWIVLDGDRINYNGKDYPSLTAALDQAERDHGSTPKEPINVVSKYVDEQPRYFLRKPDRDGGTTATDNDPVHEE